MPRAGDYFEEILEEVHLNWGTTSNKGSRNRNPFESYIPIRAPKARELNILQGSVYNVKNANFQVKAGGSQGINKEYGKNLESKGNLTLLGYFLRDNGAHVGSTVRVEWITNAEVSITIL